MVKLLLKNGTVATILGRVEESEVQTVSNILSIFSLCLFCVNSWTKGVLSTMELAQWGARTGEREREEEATLTILRECRKYKKEKGQVVQFSEDLQNFAIGSVVSSCAIGVQSQKQRPKNEYNMSSLMKISVSLSCILNSKC